MQDKQYILALDEGTSSAKALIFDSEPRIVSKGKCKFTQYYPEAGWVEHDPEEIWQAQKKAVKDALKKGDVDLSNIDSIGVTNQRETTVLWDKESGEPVNRALVWQDRRTSEMIDELSEEEKRLIKEKTGLVPDSYFSASKIKWLLDNDEEVKRKTEKEEILFGTVDSYLIYRLTGGEVHATDHSNASRTMLYNINELEWDDELLDIFNIPKEILPEVRESSDHYGLTSKDIIGEKIPITGCAGDQQAALFGQCCFERGMVKNTYGTGNFVLMNVGKEPIQSENLLTTIAWTLDGEVTYALEGSVFISGAGLEWLQESIDLLEDPAEAERLATSIEDNDGVYLVPAFVGLGAPYWDQYARGTIVGMTRGTSKAHLARASLESMVYFSEDIFECMERDSGLDIDQIRADGGCAKNDFLLQFQADISRKDVIRSKIDESTALGAAYLASLYTGCWKDKDALQERWAERREFRPELDIRKKERFYRGWKRAVERAKNWVEPNEDKNGR